jgi:hypothetical protein
VNLALETFRTIVDRRDELRLFDALTPAEMEGLAIVEELVAALAGSNDGQAIAAHVAELSHSSLRFLQ